MKRTILLFSILILCILLLFQVSKYAFFKGDLSIEIGISLIAIAFFFIGIYLSKKNFPKSGEENSNIVDYRAIKELNISNREYDVLLALSENLSNREVAEKLFISENTVKKHVSKLFSKLEVSKRQEVINKAKKLSII